MTHRHLIILFAVAGLLMPACRNANLERDLAVARSQLVEAQLQLEACRDSTLVGRPGFIHKVYFWLKKDVTAAQRAAMEEGMASLRRIPSVLALYYGTPAGTPREVVDNSYDYTLTVFFADQAGHDAYQVDSIHQALVEHQRELWARVQIYDDLVK